MENKSFTYLRLINQQILGTFYTKPQQIVSHMGAIQAQDYNMAKWAVAIRIAGCTEKEVEKAFNDGKILRTHVLRPTWHFVVPENIRWMLQLSAKRIINSMKSRDRDLGLTDEIYGNCYRIIEKTLGNKDCLTREELAIVLHEHGMKADSSQMTHLMFGAEATGIICSGAIRGKKQTYALLEKRVPATKPLTKEEALSKLALIYFSGHGPATLQDFVWWSGLSTGEARQGLESVKSDFVSEDIDSQTYWMPNSNFRPSTIKSIVYLLPAFDEYIIGYTNRDAVLPAKNLRKAVSTNGIFRPVIIKDGKVVGIWRKTITKNKIITPEFFDPIDDSTLRLIEEASERFRMFIK